MAIRIIVPPTVEPVSLAEAKIHCKEDGNEQDSRISGFISASRQLAEQKTNRAFSPRTLEFVLDSFPELIRLPNSPVVSIVHIKYIDPAGSEQTINPADYQVDIDTLPARLVPGIGKVWTAVCNKPASIRIRYVCGHEVDDPAIAALKQWMLIAIGTWYKHAEATEGEKLSSLPRTYVDGLLDEYKVYE